MSTLNVANISDDQSTLTNGANSSDLLNNTTTVDTKYVTNGCVKAYVRSSSTALIICSFNTSSATNHGTGDYSYSITNAYVSDNDFVQTAATLSGTNNVRWVTVNSSRTNANTLSTTTRNSDGTLINTSQSATSYGDLA
jgi:hypothetical protein